ncbi:hypothetical protein BKA70DRAFT_1223357 [Coprinopsis sp. MPI-PUGE-AT-0042]|nr:hypothetical protein BKA70DRAFT_1223357 [Coprinopsis sp. MPI-PUGE-AT-0042]
MGDNDYDDYDDASQGTARFVMNRQNVIDPALRRSSRFGREFEIGTSLSTLLLPTILLHNTQYPAQELEGLASKAYRNVVVELGAVVREGGTRATTKRWAASDAVSSVGASDTILKLREAVKWPLVHPEAFNGLDVRPPKGSLKYLLASVSHADNGELTVVNVHVKRRSSMYAHTNGLGDDGCVKKKRWWKPSSSFGVSLSDGSRALLRIEVKSRDYLSSSLLGPHIYDGEEERQEPDAPDAKDVVADASEEASVSTGIPIKSQHTSGILVETCEVKQTYNWEKVPMSKNQFHCDSDAECRATGSGGEMLVEE